MGGSISIPDDHESIYRYEDKSGAIHQFCSNDIESTPLCGDLIKDAGYGRSLSKLDFVATRDNGDWVLDMDDGTRMIFGYQAVEVEEDFAYLDQASGGGRYVTRIETTKTKTVGSDQVPQAWVRFEYSGNKLVRIFDSEYDEYVCSGQPEPCSQPRVELTETAGTVSPPTPDTLTIEFPKFLAKDETVRGPNVEYTLEFEDADINEPLVVTTGSNVFFGDLTVDYDYKSAGAQPRGEERRLLRNIRIPSGSGDPVDDYVYSFHYDVDDGGTPAFLNGRLTEWTIPTGATVSYEYAYFATGGSLHTEMRRRTINADGEDYVWKYHRHGGTIPDTLDDVLEPPQFNQSISWSNPRAVDVIDPVGNLTRHHFNATATIDGQCGSYSSCPPGPLDGTLRRTETYLGVLPSSDFLIQSVDHEYEVLTPPPSAPLYFMRDLSKPTPGGSNPPPGANRNPTPPDKQATITKRYGLGLAADQELRVETLEYQSHNRPRRVKTIVDGQLYRESVTEWGTHPRAYSSKTTYDAQGTPIAREDASFDGGRLLCRVQRADAAQSGTFTDCASPGASAGDMIWEGQYDISTDLLESSERRVHGDPLGQTVEREYTYSGMMKTATEFTGSSGLLWKPYDRDVDHVTGLTTASRDTLGNETLYDFDSLGRLVAITPALPEAPTTIDYETVHRTRLTKSIDSTNFVEQVYEYDQLGRLTRETNRLSDGTTAERLHRYDALNRSIAVSEWRETTSTDAPVWYETSYSPGLNPETGELGPPEELIDPLGRIHRLTNPDGSTVTTEFRGLLKSVTQSGIAGLTGPIDSQTDYLTDPLGRLIEVDSPGNGADAKYQYDEFDRLTEVHLFAEGSSMAQVRGFLYDDLGRMEYEVHPESGVTQYADFDAFGNARVVIDASGDTYTSGFDQAGRLTERKIATASDPLTDHTLVDLAYDENGFDGLLTTEKSYQLGASGASLVVEKAFDYSDGTGCLDADSWLGLNGRIRSVSQKIAGWDQNVTTEWCYSALGAESAILYPREAGSNRPRAEVHSETVNGYVARIHDARRDPVGDVEYAHSIEYSAAGVPTSFERHSGVVNKIARDSMNRPLRFDVLDSQAATLWSTGNYAYDGAGNISSIGPYDHEEGPLTFERQKHYYYDALNRLVHFGDVDTADGLPVLQESYQYDSFGNMLEKLLVDGKPGFEVTTTTTSTILGVSNRLDTVAVTGAGPKAIEYDARGNLTSWAQQGKAAARRYLFGPDNRLLEAWDEKNAGSTNLGRYFYDASGYRVLTVEDEIETFFLRDPSGRLLTEYRRKQGFPYPPVWYRDHIYGLGQALSVVKNEAPGSPTGLELWGECVTGSWIGKACRSDDDCKHSSGPGDCLTPGEFDGTLIDRDIELTWSPVDDEDLAWYIVLREITRSDQSQTFEQFFVGDGQTVPPTEFVDTVVVAENVTGTLPDNAIAQGDLVRYYLYSYDSANIVGYQTDQASFTVADATAPEAPVLSASPLDGSVSLSWTHAAGEEIAGYVLERRPDSTSPWVQRGGLRVGLTYLDLNSGADFLDYQVRAIDTAGNLSPESNIVTVDCRDTIPPPVPVGLEVAACETVGCLDMRWLPGGTASEVSGYKVYYDGGSGWTSACGSQAWCTDQTEFAVVVPFEGVDVAVAVKAVDLAGNASDMSPAVIARTRTAAIAAPTGLSAVFNVQNPSVAAQTAQACIDVEICDPNDSSPHEENCTFLSCWTNEITQLFGSWSMTQLGSPPCDHYGEFDDFSYGYDLSWNGPTNGSYIVYRRETTGSGLSPVAQVDDATVYRDEGALCDGCTYFVAQVDSGGIESAATPVGSVDHGASYPSSPTYVCGYDGRKGWSGLMKQGGALTAPHDLDEFRKSLEASRFPVIRWSPVFRGDVVGYNIYRRCPTPSASGLDEDVWSDQCQQAWIRLNAYPVAGTTYTDVSTDLTKGKYLYVVRAAFADGSEGDIFRGVEVRLSGQFLATDNPQYRFATQHLQFGAADAPVGERRTQNGLESIGGTTSPVSHFNLLSRGAADPAGPPAVPLGVSGGYLKAGPAGWFWPAFRDAGYDDDSSILSLEWQPNKESDLQGYHVEVAVSASGPWRRLTPAPIVWWNQDAPDGTPGWEPTVSFAVQGLELPYACLHARVIAVDEDGFESQPATAAMSQSQQGCAGYVGLDAPENVTAETDESSVDVTAKQCDTILSWDHVSNADAYTVFRLPLYFGDLSGQLRGFNEFVEIATVLATSNCSAGRCSVSTPAQGAGETAWFRDEWTAPAAYFIVADDTGSIEIDASHRSEIVVWNCIGAAYAADPGLLATMPSSRTYEYFADLQCPVGAEEVSSSWAMMAEARLAVQDGPNRGIPLRRLGQAANPSYETIDLHVDHVGSVVLETDRDGQFREQHAYLPFGSESSEPSDHTTKAFSGHEADQRTGLTYMGGRYYHTEIARFLSPDPVRKNNLYAYASNNPLRFVDPDGLDEVPVLQSVVDRLFARLGPLAEGRFGISKGYASSSLSYGFLRPPRVRPAPDSTAHDKIGWQGPRAAGADVRTPGSNHYSVGMRSETERSGWTEIDNAEAQDVNLLIGLIASKGRAPASISNQNAARSLIAATAHEFKDPDGDGPATAGLGNAAMSDVFGGWNMSEDGAEKNRMEAAREFEENNPDKEVVAGANGRWFVRDRE